MDTTREEESMIVQRMIYHGFADVTQYMPELTEEHEMIILYKDEKIVISSDKKQDYGIFLIFYNEKYYTAFDSLEYIIKKFYEIIVE